jgi:hypothetical protein
MHGSWGLRGTQRTAAALGALALAVVLFLVLPGPASAARIVGKDGKVYACYKTKGKAKGNVRLIPKRSHCRRGEKKVSWNATGPGGQSGENGGAGENGSGGETGAGGTAGLETRVTNLLNRVETLEDKLKGITNLALSEVLSKLQGVSGAQLQQAIGAVADVNALCSQATVLTSQVDSLGTALGGLSLGGVIPLGLKLLVPNLPASLPSFGCP